MQVADSLFALTASIAAGSVILSVGGIRFGMMSVEVIRFELWSLGFRV